MTVIALMFPTLIQLFLGVEAVDEPNLAEGKPASQSSTLPGPYDVRAEKAVDGSTHGSYKEGQSCSHTTEGAATHWWMVDLEATYTIRSVRISNHLSCCSHKLAQFTIEVSDEHPSTLKGFPEKTGAAVCRRVPGRIPKLDDFPLSCIQPVTGRYVMIVKPSAVNMALVICELKVYEEDVAVTPPPPTGPNLALGKPATQISTDGTGFAWKAVDGNRNEVLSGDSCSVTRELSHYWWQVDLLENRLIGSVSIVNRLDWVSWYLRDFVVEISEENPSTLNGFPRRTNAPVCVSVRDKVPVPEPFNFKCDQPLIGRYVRLVRPSRGRPLIICEFEVYAPEPTTAPPPTPVPNVINEHRAFQYVSSKGSRHAIGSSSARRDIIISCGQKFLFNVADVKETPYMQVDTMTGKCQYLKSIAEGQDSLSENWVIYEATNL